MTARALTSAGGVRRRSRDAADRPMTAAQAATLKRLAEAAYELDAFKPNLTGAEADLRIAMLTAKLKPAAHTLKRASQGLIHGLRYAAMPQLAGMR